MTPPLLLKSTLLLLKNLAEHALDEQGLIIRYCTTKNIAHQSDQWLLLTMVLQFYCWPPAFSWLNVSSISDLRVVALTLEVCLFVLNDILLL